MRCELSAREKKCPFHSSSSSNSSSESMPSSSSSSERKKKNATMVQLYRHRYLSSHIFTFVISGLNRFDVWIGTVRSWIDYKMKGEKKSNHFLEIVSQTVFSPGVRSSSANFWSSSGLSTRTLLSFLSPTTRTLIVKKSLLRFSSQH